MNSVNPTLNVQYYQQAVVISKRDMNNCATRIIKLESAVEHAVRTYSPVTASLLKQELVDETKLYPLLVEIYTKAVDNLLSIQNQESRDTKDKKLVWKSPC